MEQHKKCLQNLCRVCGKKPKGYTHDKQSDVCKAALLCAFQIVVEQENDEVYPSVVCHCCYLTLRQLQLAKETGHYRETDLVPQTWSQHSDLCQLCVNTPTTPRGRPKKRKAIGRPKADDIHQQSRRVLHHLGNLHTHKYAECALEVTHFLPSAYLEYLHCQMCTSIPNEPVQVRGCQHLMCLACVSSACKDEKNTLACPCNSLPVLAVDLHLPSVLTQKCLDSLLIRCTKGCGEIIQLKDLMNHVNSICTDTPIPSPSSITVEQLLQLHSDNLPSQLRANTTSLLVEKVFPSNGPLTCRSSSGKV